MQLWSFFSFHLLQLTELRFVDWAAILVYGKHLSLVSEGVLAFLIQIIFSGFLGIIFAYLLRHITSHLYLLKGVIFALIIGFFIYATPVLFQTPLLKEANLGTVLSNQIGGLLWGLTCAYTLMRLKPYETIVSKDPA